MSPATTALDDDTFESAGGGADDEQCDVQLLDDHHHHAGPAAAAAAAAAASSSSSPLPNPSSGSDGGDDDGNHPMSLLPTLAEVLACQISAWYPTFASRSIGSRNHAGDDDDGRSSPTSMSPSSSTPDRSKSKRRSRLTIRTILLDMPTEFVDAYLTSQGTVRLPPGAVTSSILRTGRPAERDDDNSDSDNSDDWSSDSSTPRGDNRNEGEQPPLPLFTELDDAIRAAIQELGGAVVPKLNWSAPKDASWMNAGSLKCQTPGDIYLLLQSSDFVSYDIHHALTDVRRDADANNPRDKKEVVNDFAGYQLALRKWCTLHPSQEFRCFVAHRQLIAISQRHFTSHYPHLVRNQDDIRLALRDFHDDYVVNTFAMDAPGVPIVSHYVMDAYIDQHNKVWIIDFNVWGRRTDPLLFTWEELNAMSVTTSGAAPATSEDGVAGTSPANEEAAHEWAAAASAAWPVLRVVETSKQVRHDPLASYRAPIDAVHVAGLGGGSGHFGSGSEEGGFGPDVHARGGAAFDEFAKLCHRPSELDVDDDDDDSDEE